MTYSLNKPTGSYGLNPIPVLDNTIDSALYDSTNNIGVQLVGRNTTDYGTAIAQNIVQMVSNFSGSIVPKPDIALQGQLWFEATSSTTGSLYVRITSSTATQPNQATDISTNWQQIVTQDNSGNSNISGNLTVGGNLTVSGNLTVDGFIAFSTASSISAAGSNQGTATPITKSINIVTSVPVASGVILPIAVAGYRIVIRNNTTTDLLVYPNTGASIDGNAVNLPVTHTGGVLPAPGTALEYFCSVSAISGSGGQWNIMNAAYA